MNSDRGDVFLLITFSESHHHMPGEYILIWSPHCSWERSGITLVIIYTPIHPPGRIRPGGKGFILACLPCVDTWTGPANWDVRACVSTDPWLVSLSYLASQVHRFSFWRKKKKKESEFCVLRSAMSFSFQIPFQKHTICFSQILLHWAKPLNPPVYKLGHRDPSRVSDTLSRSNKLGQWLCRAKARLPGGPFQPMCSNFPCHQPFQHPTTMI